MCRAKKRINNGGKFNVGNFILSTLALVICIGAMIFVGYLHNMM